MPKALRPVLVLMAALALLIADAVHAAPVRLRRPRHGVQLRVGPVAVPRGDEVTECSYFKLPSRKDLAVDRVQIKVKGGSHHVHLYRTQDPTRDVPDGHETCNFALDFGQWQLVLASQGLYLDWKLPKGVAFHFTAGEQLAAQTHFVDTGLLRTRSGKGWAAMNLHTIPAKKVRAYAGSIFGQDRDVVVPAHSTATATTRCLFPDGKEVSLLAITGHYHYRGRHFSAASWDGDPGAPVRILYDHDGYEDPPFVRFGEADAPKVRGIQWTCEYENTDDVDHSFGPFTDENEHCNLFAFYYPTASPQEDTTCVQKDGVVTVTVQGR
jgi:hypothetical protein